MEADHGGGDSGGDEALILTYGIHIGQKYSPPYSHRPCEARTIHGRVNLCLGYCCLAYCKVSGCSASQTKRTVSQISVLGSSQYDRFWSFWSCGFVEACGINSGAAPHHQVPKPLAPDKSPGRIQGLRFRVYQALWVFWGDGFYVQEFGGSGLAHRRQ